MNMFRGQLATITNDKASSALNCLEFELEHDPINKGEKILGIRLYFAEMRDAERVASMIREQIRTPFNKSNPSIDISEVEIGVQHALSVTVQSVGATKKTLELLKEKKLIYSDLSKALEDKINIIVGWPLDKDFTLRPGWVEPDIAV